MSATFTSRARLWRFAVSHLSHNRLTVRLEQGRYAESATIVFPGDWKLVDRVEIQTDWGGLLMSVSRNDVQLLHAMETCIRYRDMRDQIWSVKLPLGMYVPEACGITFVITTNDNRAPDLIDPVYAMVLLDYEPT